MREQNDLFGRESRRSFMKKGAATTGGLAFGLSGVGSATAEGTDATAMQNRGGKALMFNDDFRPGAQFRVISPVIEQQPDVEGVQQGDIWSDYNTRIVEYLNTNEQTMFFPAHAAELKQGQVYQLRRNFSLFADDTNDEGIISVSFQPVGNDQIAADDDFDVLDEGGGKALVRGDVFHPNALFRIVSDVVEWTPGGNVAGSDIFSDYNSRFAEYLNANDKFLFYPAADAEVSRDAVYVMEKEFDITDPEGNLLTVEFSRVDEETVNDNLL